MNVTVKKHVGRGTGSNWSGRGAVVAALSLAAAVGGAQSALADSSTLPGYFSTVLRVDPTPGTPDMPPFTYGSALSNNGQIVGAYSFDDIGFLWSEAGGVQTLSSVFEVSHSPFVGQIKDNGDVVGGFSPGDGSFGFFAFQGNVSDGSFSPLPGLAPDPGLFSGASAMNDLGIIVGGAQPNSTSPFNAVMWTSRDVINLGTLGGDSSAATSVNNFGVVVGISEEAPFGPNRAFRWDATSGMEMLPMPAGALVSVANFVSDSGHIVGEVGDGVSRSAVIWGPDGSLEILPWHIEGDGFLQVAEVRGANNNLQIVGQEHIPNLGGIHAMLWQDGKSYVLGEHVVDLPAGIRLDHAVDINDNGQILVNAFDTINIEFVTVLLTPVPTPSSALVFAVGAAVMGRRRR